VWILAESADIVMRIDSATNRVVEQRDVCDRPIDIIAEGAAAWIACADARVWEVGASGDDPVITILDGVPGGLAQDGDRAWVTVRES
jgi:hypothetical protein